MYKTTYKSAKKGHKDRENHSNNEEHVHRTPTQATQPSTRYLQVTFNGVYHSKLS